MTTPPLAGTELWARRIRLRSRWLRQRARWCAARATSVGRVLPDFIVIGAARSGTTSLFRYLCEHPLVCGPLAKEVRYFAFHADRSVGWYRAHFPTRSAIARTGRAARGNAITGEASPAYLPHPLAAERAARAVPDARLIAVLRDPVERAISEYHFAVAGGHETRPIEDAIAEGLRQADVDHPISEYDDLHGWMRLNNYVARGHYAEGLARWYRWFDRSQVLVLETRDLSRSGGAGFARVLEFLGLPPWGPPAFPEHNAGDYPPAPDSVRTELVLHYEPHNAALWDLLGAEFGWSESARGRSARY